MALEIQASAPIPVVSELASRGASPLTTWVGVLPQNLLTAAFLKRNGVGNPSLCPDPCGERAGLARGKPAHHMGWCVATEPELIAASLNEMALEIQASAPIPVVSELASRGASPLTTWVGVLPRNLSCLPLLANEMALKTQASTPILVVSELASRGASPLTTWVGVLPRNLS